MEPRVAYFEQELAHRRERYNAAYAMARRLRPRLDGEQFLHNLRTLVAPILAELDAGAGVPLVEPLYDLCLELTGADLFGRSPAVSEVWRRLLPQAGAVLAESPRRLAAALTNAAYNMEREDLVHLDAWFSKMESCRGLCSGAEEWLQVGQVLAWRYGMAHFRESAIAVGQSLPSELRYSLAPNWDSEVRDPWHSLRAAYQKPGVVRRLGSFQGFGGKFRQPPWVAYAGDGRFLVEDGTESWLLNADAYGATLKRGTGELIEDERSEVVVHPDGRVNWSGHSLELPELSPVKSQATSHDILAVTSELSHHVFLILGPSRDG